MNTQHRFDTIVSHVAHLIRRSDLKLTKARGPIVTQMPNANVISSMEQEVPVEPATLVASLLNSHEADRTNALTKALEIKLNIAIRSSRHITTPRQSAKP